MIETNLPGLERSVVQAPKDLAHLTCQYSKVTFDNTKLLIDIL